MSARKTIEIAANRFGGRNVKNLPTGLVEAFTGGRIDASTFFSQVAEGKGNGSTHGSGKWGKKEREWKRRFE